MPEYNGNKHRDFLKFDNMSTEMLEDILRADSQLPDGENSDTDAILYIMEVIAKREKEHPTGKFTDVHDAWASFSENYLPYIDDDKSLYDFADEEKTGIRQAPSPNPSRPLKKSRFMRVAFVAATVTALLLAGTITASAFGFDLWGAVAKWTRETFGFTSQSPTENPEGYDSLQAALSQYGITEPLAPSWIPDGYILSSIDVSETPVMIKFCAIYKNGDGILSIVITDLIKGDPNTFEKDDNGVTVYVAGKVEHYLMSNNGRETAVWVSKTYECSISGNISETEIEQMIDSIYER